MIRLLLVLLYAAAVQWMHASLLSPLTQSSAAGHVSDMSLNWNISEIAVAKRNKVLLRDVYGYASRGKLHAILGILVMFCVTKLH